MTKESYGVHDAICLMELAMTGDLIIKGCQIVSKVMLDDLGVTHQPRIDSSFIAGRNDHKVAGSSPATCLVRV